jgi:hypothetical protein
MSAPEHDHVRILLGDDLVRELNVSRDDPYPRFNLLLKRDTVAMLPAEGELRVTTPEGEPLIATGGTERLRLRIPHGDGTLVDVLAAGNRVDKKGELSPSLEQTREQQQRYLELYDEINRFFELEFDKPLLLMYGTLLGFHRDGDLIPSDDDFDAGYVSDLNDPVAVKEETKRIILTLVRAGFNVTFNRRGRLFRAQSPRFVGARLHLDLRPIWFQDGRVWVHNHASFPSSRDDFLPAAEGELRGVRVRTPRNPETFLAGHYGPGWRVPDPGFIYYPSDVDPRIHANLEQALITPPEYRELKARADAEAARNPDAGFFLGVGAQDLYPLDRLID